MLHKESASRKLFLVFNYIFVALVTITCMFPIINVLAMSFSDSALVAAGEVFLWPKGFNLEAYRFSMMNDEFWKSVIVALERVAVGVPLNLLLTILAAYPLSRTENSFKARNIYIWYFMVTMLFNGGLIPTYIVVAKTGLIDKLLALVIPGAVPVFNVILLMNFFRSLPKEIEESAFIDGAGYNRVLWELIVPLSKPALATITLFSLVFHWNSWFDGLIYMNFTDHYPLQTYLQVAVMNAQAIDFSPSIQKIIDKMNINPRTMRAAQLFISIIPILVVYPLLQRYFTTGIVMGSVKG